MIVLYVWEILLGLFLAMFMDGLGGNEWLRVYVLRGFSAFKVLRKRARAKRLSLGRFSLYKI